jgi:hypothetical protein
LITRTRRRKAKVITIEYIIISIIEAYIVIKIGLTTIEDTRTITGTIVVEIDIAVDIETEIITTKEAIITVEMDSTKEAIIIISVIITYR